jgi:hypothetical protein
VFLDNLILEIGEFALRFPDLYVSYGVIIKRYRENIDYLYLSQPAISGIALQCSRIISSCGVSVVF